MSQADPGNPSHYEVLQVAVDATERQIKQAYRRMARLTHPDHGGSPASFRRVSAAYETLIDPAKRARYDRSFGSGRQPSADAGPTVRTAPAGPSQPGPRRAAASDPPVYYPPYDGTGVPLLSRRTAAQPVHGAPRKRGIFGAAARLQREALTAQLLMQSVLSRIPSARLVNGVHSPAGDGHIDHVVLAGYRMALIGSMMLPEGAYRWDGAVLHHGGKVIQPPRMAPAVRAAQEVFPECNVQGWVVVHSPSGNLHEPVVDHGRGGDPFGHAPVQVVNAARLVREVRDFLSAGPSPNEVNVPVLARLLRGMY